MSLTQVTHSTADNKVSAWPETTKHHQCETDSPCGTSDATIQNDGNSSRKSYVALYTFYVVLLLTSVVGLALLLDGQARVQGRADLH